MESPFMHGAGLGRLRVSDWASRGVAVRGIGTVHVDELDGRTGDVPAGVTSGVGSLQDVHGLRGRNDIICRDRTEGATTTRHYALSDAMGSVTAIVDDGGAVLERYGYSAFGMSRVMDADFDPLTTSAHDWQIRFHGETRDAATGWYNYGYRYYLPELGRWPSRDPIREQGGVNLYGFVGNNGVNMSDEFGLKKCCVESVSLTLQGPEIHPHNRIFRFSGREDNIQVYAIILRAKFIDDDPCCCECCEIRFYISWDEEYADSSFRNKENWPEGQVPLRVPHMGFRDEDTRPGEFVEDRTPGNGRKGRRHKVEKELGDVYLNECTYSGRDLVSAPVGFKGSLSFVMIVVDNCASGPIDSPNGAAATSNIVHLTFK